MATNSIDNIKNCKHPSHQLNHHSYFCENCKEEFKRPRCWKSTYRFCSRDCANIQSRRYSTQKGLNSPNFKHGLSRGYRRITINGRRMFEHRLVMEEYLGRRLLKEEQIHHINGDRVDNRIENLQLRTTYHGSGSSFRCIDCGSTNIKPEELS